MTRWAEGTAVVPAPWVISVASSLVGLVVAAVVSRHRPRPLWSPSTAVVRQLRGFATLSGRASRSELWWPSLTFGLITSVIEVVGLLVGHRPDVLLHLLAAAVLLPGTAALVRRLHDSGRSGWWFLVGFTGIGLVLLLVWALRPSEPSANRFGPVPGDAGNDVEHLSRERPWTTTGPPRRPWLWASLTVIGLLGYTVGQVDLDVTAGSVSIAGVGLLLGGYVLLGSGLIGLRGAPLVPSQRRRRSAADRSLMTRD